MSDDDFEVEYLEEDEDIVQNCLETLQAPPELNIEPPKIIRNTRVSPSSLLVERGASKANKASKKSNQRKTHDDDSDYQPYVEDEDSDYDLEEKRKRPKRQRKQPAKYTRDYPKPHSVFIRVPSMLDAPSEKSAPKNEFSTRISVKTMDSRLKNQTFLQKPSQQTLMSNVKNTTPTLQDKRKKPASPGTMLSKVLPGIKPNLNMSYSPIMRKFQSTSPASKRFELKSESKTGGQLPKVLPHSFKLFMNDIYLCDYADPECTDGKLSDDENKQKWNDLCRERVEKYESEKVISAKTTQCFKKVSLKDGKDAVRLRFDAKIDGKSDAFQAILPPFETSDVKVKFDADTKRRLLESSKSTMILTKEIQKDEQILVAFSSTDFRSTTYKLEEDGEINGNKVKKFLKMLMSCKICASCYQYSWRGNKDQKVAGDVRCSTCNAIFTSAYNLLAHVRSHRLTHLDRYKQNKILSKIMKYHYGCRLCRYRASSIKDLRRHLLLHRSVQKFKCEVGQHFTY